MAKMYYTETEASQKLNLTPAQLTGLVREGKLRVFADGSNKMFKVTEVDTLASASKSQESDIQLMPADASGTHETLSLSDSSAQGSKGGSKSGSKSGTKSGTRTGGSDTVITAEGISIFDDEDLEIESADPMAKTQIAPSLEDGIGIESGSGGSGLLDLTRESDDTSLGAEVLDHIDVEGEVPSAESVAESVSTMDMAEPAVAEPVVVVDRIDPMALVYACLSGAGAVLLIVLSAVAMAVMTGQTPGYVMSLGENVGIVVGVMAVVALAAAGVGYFLTRQAAGKAAAAQSA